MPSWFFGDGAAIFNQKLASTSLPGRIQSLDTMLTSSSATVGGGLVFGARVTRSMTPRLAIEGSVDITPRPIELTDDALADLHSAKAAFASAFPDLLLLVSSGQTVTASTNVDSGTGLQVAAGVGLRIYLSHGTSTRPFAYAGGGFLATTGEGPTVTVVGDYQFVRRQSPFPPMHETDTVVIRYGSANTGFLRVGGGVTHDFNQRTGLRGDAFFTFAPNRLRIAVSTAPSAMPGDPQGVAGLSGQPGIQFSTVTATPTSLSLPLSDFETFAGSGWRTQFAATVGFVVRF